VLPAGAINGDPQFTSFYDSDGMITAYGVLKDYLARDVKARGYDCTGHRQKSLYMQALAGNKKAKESLDTVYHGAFPSRPVEAWAAIEKILHGIYANYLKHYGCPDRLYNHPLYPAISPPLPNPVKLRGYILRARKARDTITLSWMLGREMKSNELHAKNAGNLVLSVINRFGYTSAEIAVMRSIVNERRATAVNGRDNKADEDKESGGFLLGCFLLFAPIALCFAALSLTSYLMKNCGIIGIFIGLLSVIGFLIILCRVFRGKKGRPP